HLPADCQPAPIHSDWDYAAVPDSTLVVLACEIGDRDAVRLLIARNYPWLRGLIGRRARRAGLRREDAGDAQQDVVFALLEAIAASDVRESAQPGGCSFRTFLGRRAASRFVNELYRLRRLAARRRGEVELVAALEERAGRWPELERRDPAVLAQW